MTEHDGLEGWIDGARRLEDVEEGDAGDAVVQLFRAARRAQVELAPEQAERVLTRVRALAEERRRRVWGSPTARWFAGLAAAVGLFAGSLGGARLRSPAATVVDEREGVAAPPEIVKELRFESVHEGKVVHLEMTLYRTRTKEERTHAPTPSL